MPRATPLSHFPAEYLELLRQAILSPTPRAVPCTDEKQAQAMLYKVRSYLTAVRRESDSPFYREGAQAMTATLTGTTIHLGRRADQWDCALLREVLETTFDGGSPVAQSPAVPMLDKLNQLRADRALKAGGKSADNPDEKSI